MGKIFGLLLIVAGMWIGLEIHNNGMDGAFGGALDFETQNDRNARAASRTLSTPKRIGAKVERSFQEHAERVQKQLGD